MQKILYTITFLLLLIPPVVFSQQVISTTGSSITAQNCQISFTVGEPVAGIFTGNGCIVDQGFQQSWLKPSSAIPENKDCEVNFYPNPATSVLTFFGLEPQNSATVLVRDIHGKVVLSANISENETVDMSKLEKGFYLVILDFGKNSLTKKLIIN